MALLSWSFLANLIDEIICDISVQNRNQFSCDLQIDLIIIMITIIIIFISVINFLVIFNISEIRLNIRSLNSKLSTNLFPSETTSSKIQLQETKSMLQAVEVERDRLIELVGLLQKR